MLDVFFITNNKFEEDLLLEHINDRGIFLTTYDVNTRTGKKEGLKLKSYVGAKKNPCIIVYEGEKLIKCFYSEASNNVIADFLNWLNDTNEVIMDNNEVVVRKHSFEERLNTPVKVQIVAKDALPQYADSGCAGMDLRASIDEPITINPMERKLIPTGIRIKLPKGFEAQIRPRSGLALKSGITVLNTPGTIDSSYTGEIGVILINLSDIPFTVYPEYRVAQMVVTRHSIVQWVEVDELEETERGSGGFGHTGIK